MHATCTRKQGNDYINTLLDLNPIPDACTVTTAASDGESLFVTVCTCTDQRWAIRWAVVGEQ
jgi:hypothetical protein